MDHECARRHRAALRSAAGRAPVPGPRVRVRGCVRDRARTTSSSSIPNSKHRAWKASSPARASDGRATRGGRRRRATERVRAGERTHSPGVYAGPFVPLAIARPRTRAWRAETERHGGARTEVGGKFELLVQLVARDRHGGHRSRVVNGEQRAERLHVAPGQRYTGKTPVSALSNFHFQQAQSQASR
jgi:hypothetical protein